MPYLVAQFLKLKHCLESVVLWSCRAWYADYIGNRLSFGLRGWVSFDGFRLISVAGVDEPGSTGYEAGFAETE